MNKSHFGLLLLTAFALNGCANGDSARDSYVNMRTKFANGFQDISVEVASTVSSTAKIEETKIEASHKTFTVSGFITYPKSCKSLSVEVKFFAKDGSVLGNTKGFVQNYAANDRSRFKVFLLNLPTSSSELLSKAVINSVTCQ